MTTTNHRPGLADRSGGTQDGEVLDLASARDRKAMALLRRRDELGKQWADALSHDLPATEDLAYEISYVEEAIADNHPAVFNQHYSGWVIRDASLLHEPGDGRGTCAMCDVAHDDPGAA